MNNTTFTEKELREYLLGNSSLNDTERLDELSFTSDEFAGLLEAVEKDLADAYVSGELSAEDCRIFENRYLTSTSSKLKVQFAEAFQRFSAGEVTQAEPHRKKAVPKAGARETFAGFFHYFKWGFAAAAAVAIVFAGWMFLPGDKTGEDVASESNVPAANEPVNIKRPEQAGGNGTNSESGDLASTGNDTQNKQTGQSAQPQPPRNTKKASEDRSPAPRVFAFSLLPQMRSSAQLPAISIPRDAERVFVRLELEPTDFRTYQIELMDPAGRRVWRSAAVRPSNSGGRRMVTATIPTRLFATNQYTFSVSGLAPSQAPENVGDYAFRITR